MCLKGISPPALQCAELPVPYPHCFFISPPLALQGLFTCLLLLTLQLSGLVFLCKRLPPIPACQVPTVRVHILFMLYPSPRPVPHSAHGKCFTNIGCELSSWISLILSSRKLNSTIVTHFDTIFIISYNFISAVVNY